VRRAKFITHSAKDSRNKFSAPRAFARLRCHVVLALRSKYAVTLYEILEAYVNDAKAISW